MLAISGCMEQETQPVRTPTFSYTVPTTYEKVNFKKLINPAFCSQYYGKGVEFEAKFMGQLDMMIDLPPEYKNGYVRVMLTTEEEGATMCNNFVIPKDKSDIVFDSKQFDIWTIKARGVAITSASAITGRSGQGILLVADDIKLLRKAKEEDQKSEFPK